jgi:hypothetical protein
VSLAARIVAVAALALVIAPRPAPAIPGLERVQGDSLFNRDEPHKVAIAKCPPGKLVVGAGAEVLDGDRTLVRLIGVRPSRPQDPSTTGGSVTASAESANLTRAYDWSLRAYAVCATAEALGNYFIVSVTSPYSAKAFETASARCTNGRVVYGAGAQVSNTAGGSASGKVWLQLYRTSQPLDISRATGRAMPGFDGGWRLRSYAICAVWRDQLFADGTIAQGAEASDRCFTAFTHGIGGGGGLTDGGPVWLDKIRPHVDLRGVDVSLTGALDPSIGGMLAHQTCAF